jgi:hypothetical protein
MPEQPQSGASPPDSADVAGHLPESSDDARPLTPEEQMAAFEKELKESDWGHQPC